MDSKKMTFYATDEEMYQIVTNAINASSPVGMGRFHYEHKVYNWREVKEMHESHGDAAFPDGVDLDYVAGRMVKLRLRRAEGKHNVWLMPQNTPNEEYQSWVHRYPSYYDLIASVTLLKK